MIFDWNDFYTLAGDLGKQKTEAAKRTAISRLYYSIYWRARIFLEDEGFIFRQNDSSHRQIWQEFKNRGRTFLAISIWGQNCIFTESKLIIIPKLKKLTNLSRKHSI